MKSKKDILIRAIVLLCVTDRAFLETATVGDKTYSREQRREQQDKIYSWLKKMGYHHYMTPSEITLFEATVEGVNAERIYNYRFQYEAIATLLWALNSYEMSDCAHFSLEDFHSVLCIGQGHNLNNLLNTFQIRSENEIALQTEVAMLWHWRSMEMGKVPKGGRSWGDCIKRIFGDEYAEVLDQIPQDTKIPHDFLIGDKPVCELNETEQRIYSIVAYWRHHAFEWIMSDDAWDDVSADT